MELYYLVLVVIFIHLPASNEISWMSNLCEKDTDCPADKCCRIVNTRITFQQRSVSGHCVHKGQCNSICHTDTDCKPDECCKINHAGAYYGSCSPRLRYRKRGCLATANLLAPVGQHYVCPCDTGLQCTGTGVQSGYGETGICKDFSHPIRCSDDKECSRRRCCRFGYCVIPFGGARKNRCGAFKT